MYTQATILLLSRNIQRSCLLIALKNAKNDIRANHNSSIPGKIHGNKGIANLSSIEAAIDIFYFINL